MKIPVHVAVIMDGNRRWARQRFLPAPMGHRAGVKALRTVLETCSDLGVRHLTAYAFSAENWRRTPTEVKILMQLFERYVKTERQKMIDKGVRFNPIGEYHALPEAVWKEFEKTRDATAHNSKIVLNLAVNYGGRDEIIKATRILADQVRDGTITSDQIDEAAISRLLYTHDQPDPDLLIRTSGELRISNFLLWQTAYSEFYFTDCLWPDVNAQTIYEAFRAYEERDRRFGGGKPE